MKKILVINPGSTSTKFAVFHDEECAFQKTLRHQGEELAPYPTIASQYEFRKETILNALKAEGIAIDFDIIVGRGGLLKPIPSGVYEVNDLMRDTLLAASYGEHACNLGGLIAADIAKAVGCKAVIADPVVVDELQDVARVSGLPEIPNISIFHALNQKAIARRYAKEIGRPYEELNVVVAHLGGGVSVGAHYKGKVIDVNCALGGDGPFSPERVGTVSASRSDEPVLQRQIYQRRGEEDDRGQGWSDGSPWSERCLSGRASRRVGQRSSCCAGLRCHGLSGR